MTGSSGQILKNRSFRRLFLARSASLLGDAIATVALAFAILDPHHGGSPTELGLVLFARAPAQAVFLLLGGVLADRWSRWRLMVASEIVAGFAQAAVSVMFLTGTAELAPLMALSALSGAATAMFFPASSGVIPQIVGADQLQRANALLRVSISVSSIVGAAIAGVLVATLGPGWALAIDAGTFLLSAALLAGVGIPDVPAARPSNLLNGLREGWREFRSRRWVWVVVAQYAIITACYSGCMRVLGPVIAQRHFHGAVGWSAILATEATGFLLGSLFAIRHLRPDRPLRAATFATFGYIPPLILLAFAAPLWLVGALMLINGICSDIFEVLWITALQHHVPDWALSRVTSYDALGSSALGPVGLAVAGPLSQALGVTETFIAAGTLMLIVSATVLLTPAVRNLTAGIPQSSDQAVIPT